MDIISKKNIQNSKAAFSFKKMKRGMALLTHKNKHLTICNAFKNTFCCTNVNLMFNFICTKLKF